MTANIVVAGGGLAGMALALALHRQGQAVAIFDARRRGAARHDQRILALSHGSQGLLAHWRVWQPLAAAGQAAPICHIDVSERGGFARTRLCAAEMGVPALGYSVRAGDLAAVLDEAIAAAQIPFHAASTIPETATAATLKAALLVRAEGEVSAAVGWMRDYRQSAIIATVRLTMPHADTAWERFTANGPIALLPLTDTADTCALVWTVPGTLATSTASLPDAEFLAQLTAQFDHTIRFSQVSTRHVFPLRLRYRKTIIGPRCVWIGNAAQTLHPVAGQGFNLALRDIHELAACLTHAPDPGAAPILNQYARWRHNDRMGFIHTTDTLARVFTHAFPPLRLARGLGLFALDMMPPLRTLFCRTLMLGWRQRPL